MSPRVDVIVLGFLLCFLSAIVNSEDTGCVFNVTNRETEKNLPVPLYNFTSHYELVVPHKGSILLEEGQSISLFCSGSRNYIKQTNSNVTTVTCIKNDYVRLLKDVIKFEEVQCKFFAKGTVRPTNERCGNNQGRIYEIGYQVTRTDWVAAIHICYVAKTGNTLYTIHVIDGTEIKSSSSTPTRVGWSNAGQSEEITASVAYRKEFQKSTFASIFKSSTLASKYINDKSFLAKGHLAPHADFLLATAQFTTYYYINAAPQWQSINTGSWKSIEFHVRDLSTYYKHLIIYTGTHGVLSYNDKSHTAHDIFLGQNKILPVPKYFWKVAYDPNTQRAIVFVIVNDPYVESVETEIFCKDICVESGFVDPKWKIISTGYAFCCDVDDFRKIVNTMPALDVSGVLSKPVG